MSVVDGHKGAPAEAALDARWGLARRAVTITNGTQTQPVAEHCVDPIGVGDDLQEVGRIAQSIHDLRPIGLAAAQRQPSPTTSARFEAGMHTPPSSASLANRQRP